jgi:hypothetical protein
VASYHRQYDETAATPVTGSMVEKGGRLYYAGGLNNVGQVFSIAVGGKSPSWSATTPRPVTGLAVGGNVLYAVTWDTLYAFDALGKTNCGGGTCNPLWTASLGSSAFPYPPVVWLGRVLVSEFGTGKLKAFDAAGVTNCSGNPKVCTPEWSDSFNGLYGPPAASADGRLFVAIRGASNVNRVAAYDEHGGFVDQSSPLGGTQLLGPALSGNAINGSVVVSRWDVNSATATLTELDAATLGGLDTWTSSALGGNGNDLPSGPTLTSTRAYVANSAGRLLAFKLPNCGAATCDPLWKSQALGTGNSVPPIVAGGVVFHAANANADVRGLPQIYGFDAAGVKNCSGAPKICTPLADITRGFMSQPGSVGNPGGMLMAGGVLYGVGADGWTAFIQ